MNCIVSTKRKEENGKYTVLVTCLECGHSVRLYIGFNSTICLSCGTELQESDYLSQKKLKQTIDKLKKEIEDELKGIERTISMGFAPGKPFKAYKKKKKKYGNISAIPGKVKEMKKLNKK